jgi:hypothetical protein
MPGLLEIDCRRCAGGLLPQTSGWPDPELLLAQDPRLSAQSCEVRSKHLTASAASGRWFVIQSTDLHGKMLHLPS